MESVYLLFAWPVAIALPLLALTALGWWTGRAVSRRWRLPERGAGGGRGTGRWRSWVSRWVGCAATLLASGGAAFGLVAWMRKMPGEAPLDVRALYAAWCLFWMLATLWNAVEGALVETAVAFRGRYVVPPLVRTVLRAVFHFVAMCVLLKVVMGYDVGVLVTSTAILTGVIGLALQGVMGNLLSGLSVDTVRIFEAGDYISVDGTEGTVESVNWRETRLRTGAGHRLVIPNGKLADSTVVNYSWRERKGGAKRIDLEVSASYAAAPEEVAGALVAAAAAQGFALKSPAPEAFPTGFGDFAITYRLRFWVADYSQHLVYRGAVLKAVWHEFQKRGIDIPYPPVATPKQGR